MRSVAGVIGQTGSFFAPGGSALNGSILIHLTRKQLERFEGVAIAWPRANPPPESFLVGDRHRLKIMAPQPLPPERPAADGVGTAGGRRSPWRSE
jgi:hypothetical protein